MDAMLVCANCLATGPVADSVLLAKQAWNGRTPEVEETLCTDCGKNPADLPGKLCQGCAAYKEHQQ